MTKAAAYPRVSSQAQADKHTIDSQLRALPAFVAARGWELAHPVEYYMDDGRSAKSGRLAERTGFQRLLRDAAAGMFDVVVVIDLDRLTRAEDLAERGLILGAFQQAGVKLAIASTGQVLDLASETGDLMAGLGAFFAAWENRKRVERTNRGRMEAIRRGRKPAGATPYGLTYSKEAKVFGVDDAAAAVVRGLFERRAAGASYEDLRAGLEDDGQRGPRGGWWTRQGIAALLRNPCYRGRWTVDKRRDLAVGVPAIVEEALWHAAQEHRGARRPRAKTPALCEGLAACELCGSALWVVGGERRYTCKSKHLRVRDLRGAPRCPNRSVRVEDADRRVWGAVRTLLDDPGLLGLSLETQAREERPGGPDWAEDLRTYSRRLARLLASEEAVLALHRRGKVSQPALERELDQVARERKLLEHNRDLAQQELARAARRREEVEAALATLAELRSRVDRCGPEERRDVLRLVFDPGGIIMGAGGILLHGQVTFEVPVTGAGAGDGSELPTWATGSASSERCGELVKCVRFRLAA